MRDQDRGRRPPPEPQRTRSKRRIRRTSRGVVFVEALLVVTLLVMLWAGLRLLLQLVDGRLEQAALSRGCAWQIALSACEDVPNHCNASRRPAPATDKTEGLRSAAPSGSGSVDDSVRSTLEPVLDGLLGDRVQIESGESIERPGLLGGGTTDVGARHSLPCNTRPGGVGDLAEEVFDDFF